MYGDVVMASHSITKEKTLAMYLYLKRTSLEQIYIDNWERMDMFASHMVGIASKARKEHGHIPDDFVEKLKRCAEQINTYNAQRDPRRTYFIYEGHNILAFVKNDRSYNHDRPFCMSLALHRTEDGWRHVLPGEIDKVAGHIALMRRLCS